MLRLFRFCKVPLLRLYSTQPSGTIHQKTIPDLYSKHASGKPISMLTAYDYITATWAGEANCDMILVGDSLAMCSLGYDSTTDMPLDEFQYHVKSVCRANFQAFLVVDMPFGSFESSIEKGVETAISMMKISSKVGAVKLEVGNYNDGHGTQDYSLRLAAELCSRGIPLVGHIGLTPQRAHSLGGFKVQGSKSAADAIAIYKTAKELQRIGCFSLLLECIPQRISEYITQSLQIPTIGIGAGNRTSGQVIVQSDMLGMLPRKAPKFVHKYADLHGNSVQAMKGYVNDVSNRTFPETDSHTFKVKDEVWEEFIANVE